MASSLISSSLHVDFDSVFGMDDAGLVQMFESFIATGLKDFLGCPAVFYEAALTEFFENSLVRDGVVVSTIRGTAIEISEEMFTAAFDLPTEGLTDLSEVPKNLVFDARSIFSESKEQVSISCLKKEMKIQYRLLSDILAKTLYVKAGSFDAVTRDRLMLMTAITCNVKIGPSDVREHTADKADESENWFTLAYKKFYGRKIDKPAATSSDTDEEIIADKPTDQLFPDEGDQPHGSETVAEEITTNDELLSIEEHVAQIPSNASLPSALAPNITQITFGLGIEIREETTAAQVDDEPASANIVEPAPEPAVANIEAVEGDQDVSPSDVGEHTADKADESENWFTFAYEKFYVRKIDEPAATSSDTDEEFIADKPTDQLFPDEGDQLHGSEAVEEEITTNDELLSIEEHLAQIPSNESLPSDLAPNITQITFRQGIEFREVDVYKASLPQIAASDKGKGILVEDHVQGHPAREMFSLICADIEFLVQLREKVIEDVSVFVSSFSLRKLATLQSEDIYAKEGQILSWAETESSFVAIQRRMLIIAKYRELLLRKFIESRRQNFVSGIQLAVGPQPLWIRNHNFGLAQRIMVKRLATSPHDPLGITDSACKNQLVVVSVQYGPFNTYIPIRSTTIGKSRVAKDPIAMHTSWISNSDIASVTREHCDVLSMQIDSDLVIYRTTLVRTFQVSTRSVLGKCVYLVTLAMSLFDLQDVCIAIGSIATLDLPMVADLIGIYGLKGPYFNPSDLIGDRSYDEVAAMDIVIWTRARWAGPSPLAAAAASSPESVPAKLDEENPFAQISSCLLVQGDEGDSYPVVDRIGVIYRNLP
ncbi:hypothetical protein F511_36389 [Dorcoceras hygrometricum]|uniref:Dystroglycan-like n=1 Tax=Dorcoceras hygrometricum TaxID=472368 RepID=A0A2Z7DJD1_9LAMI|nr:hypothetical protein F511_36389 [Dorcoceras hygrometricum]